MNPRLDFAFFGSSLVSAYWNGAATYYRGLLRALHALGHTVTFYEPDAFDRQRHRDLDDPPWAKVVVYPATDAGVERAFRAARGADALVKASGVGVYDAWLERAVIERRRAGQLALFWDVDAPATLERLAVERNDPLRALVPRFDLIFTYGGGPPVVAGYRALDAKGCVPIYNGVDPDTHHPVAAEPRFACDLAFLGHRLPDREARVRAFFFAAAEARPDASFLLAGNAWEDAPRSANVRHLGYVSPAEHNAFNASARAVLNVARDGMARFGFSPATRVFEAAGAGACLITDAWEGLEDFLEPDREVLVARDGGEVAAHLDRLRAPDGDARRHAIGDAALRRVRAQHTYAQRAAQVQRVLEGNVPLASRVPGEVRP